MKIIKYSKSSNFFLKIFADYHKNNDYELLQAKNENHFYTNQPKRIRCKICNKLLNKKIDLIQFGVEYKVCDHCNHLNGNFQDNEKFCNFLYLDLNNKSYNKNLKDNDYYNRTRLIYDPKAKFLIDTSPIKKLNILDIGCGTGNFVFSLLKKNINIVGIDISKSSIEYGNYFIEKKFNINPLFHVTNKDFFNKISSSNCNLLSAIGVLEHIRDLKKFIKCFQISNIEYIYYSIPMFSLSVFIENAFNNIFPRHLSGGHTHLFTKNSIEKLNELLGVKIISEWWFGADIQDFYRSLIVQNMKNKTSKSMIEFLNKNFLKDIDKIQKIVDKSQFCSEVHILAKKIR